MKCQYIENHLSIDQYGRFRPCCNWGFTHDDGVQSTSKALHFQNNSIQEYLDSDLKNELISMLSNNEWPKGCKSCRIAEENKTTSLRQERSKNVYGHKFDMEIKFGNLCNLACYMCTSDKSSLLYNSYINMRKLGLSDDRLDHETERHKSNLSLYNQNGFWYEDDEKIKELAVFAAQRARKIRFTGGEPTVNSYLRQFLEHVSNIDTSKIIRITTNGMSMPNSLLELLSKFRRVEITLSIDAIGMQNEYLRYPSNWNKIENNVRKLSNLKNVYFEINTVVSSLNVHLLDEIIKWGQELEVTRHQFLPVLDPNILHPRLATKEQKDKFLQTYNQYKHIDTIKLSRCKNFVLKPQAKSLLNDMYDFLYRLDKSRKTNWRDTFNIT